MENEVYKLLDKLNIKYTKIEHLHVKIIKNII